MSIFSKIFGKKEEPDVQPVPEVDYSNLTRKLFSTYIINTYSNSLRQGAQDTRDRFVTLAKHYQPLTFKQFYNALCQDVNLVGQKGFEPEIFHIESAKIALRDQNVDLGEVSKYCDCVSMVYESTLATINKEQVKAQESGKEASIDLNSDTLRAFKSSVEYGSKNDENYFQDPRVFTRQGFERDGFEFATTQNARLDIAYVESAYPGMVENSLDILISGTESAQHIIAASGKEFYPLKLQETAGQDAQSEGFEIQDFDAQQ